MSMLFMLVMLMFMYMDLDKIKGITGFFPELCAERHFKFEFKTSKFGTVKV